MQNFQKVVCVKFRPALVDLVEQWRSLPRIQRVNAAFVFALPAVRIGSGERSRVINGHRNLDLTAGTGVEPQPGVRLASLREDRHHGPVTATEDPLERLFVSRAGCGRVTGMCV